MKHKRSAKNDPQRKARVIRAQQRQAELATLSPAQQKALKEMRKIQYDSEHKS